MNAARPLSGRRILVVEDEYFIAQQIAGSLTDAGVEVVGPVATLENALLAIDRHAQLDAAVLDINLRGEKVFPVADALAARGIPFVFATSYDQAVIPERFAGVMRCDKPPSLTDLQGALGL
ncbi:MAG TPA: response regulator [Rhodanobacteraceae bacterium]|nr:response regulator [Rhodanobacteraceae bacterium]